MKLVYPVRGFRVTTQAFRQRPSYYGKFGLPGHEGKDLRAPTGTDILAPIDMVVTEARWRKPGHPYGYCVRGRRRIGDHDYELIFAHLVDGSCPVAENTPVHTGDKIGVADKTGNSPESHLHFSLKRIGATIGGETEFPSDLIDPTLLLDLCLEDDNSSP
jgi:murein DD-endopeptidase MepM/ murein hydrolase activator NlpD